MFVLLTLSGAVLGDGRTTYWSNDFAPRLDLAITWLMPIPFLVVGVLCSLVLRDVLTTVAVAGIVTTVLMGSLAGEHRALFLLCFAVMAVVDVLRAPAWLKDASLAPGRRGCDDRGLRQRRRGHSTFSVRSQNAWRRTASSLIWKEWHQAIGLTLTLAIAGAFVISLVTYFVWRGDRSFEMGLASLLPGLLLALPLVFGVASAHSDRRDGAFRLLAPSRCLAERLLADEARGRARAGAGDVLALLGWEHAMSAVSPNVDSRRLAPLWDIAHSAAHATFQNDNSSRLAILGVVIFDVILLYSIGSLCAAIIPSTLSALVIAIIGSLGLCFYWSVAAWLELVAWWSLGILPLIFLFAGWVRTRDWLVDRNSLAAWGGVTLSLVVPLTAVAGTIVVYRVVQIPPVTLPLEVQQSSPPTIVAVHPPKRSLFVDAMLALTPRPPASDMSGRLTAAEGWKYADEATRDFVAANGPARRLALQAVQQPPGDFPAEAWRGSFPTVTESLPNTATGSRISLRCSAIRLGSSSRKTNWPRRRQLHRDRAAGGSTCRLEPRSRSFRSSGHGDAGHVRDGPMGGPSAANRRADQTRHRRVSAVRASGRFRLEPHSCRVASRAATLRGLRLEGAEPASGKPRRGRNGLRSLVPALGACANAAVGGCGLRPRPRRNATRRGRAARSRICRCQLLSAGRRGTPWSWLDTTLRPPEEAVDAAWWRDTAQGAVNRAALARLHFLAWWLAGYRREHQQLPEQLSSLVPTYFSWLPVDPWTGSDFISSRWEFPRESTATSALICSRYSRSSRARDIWSASMSGR